MDGAQQRHQATVENSLAGKEAEVVDMLWSIELPPEEDTNPALWTTLMNFFRQLISETTSHSGDVCFTEDDQVLSRMKHGGRPPTCGPRVLVELRKAREVVPAPDIRDYAVPPPSATATSLSQTRAGRVVRRWTRRLLERVHGSAGAWCVRSNLEAKARELKGRLGAMAVGDRLWLVDKFADAECGGNLVEAHAVCALLAERGEWHVVELSPGKYAVKTDKSAVSATDEEVLHMRDTLDKLHKQEEQLAEASALQSLQAKKYLNDPNLTESARKTNASATLRKRKVTDGRLAHVRNLAHKMESMLAAIEQAESTGEALSTIESSAKLLQSIQVDVEDVDRVMLDLDGAVESHLAIDAAMKQQSAHEIEIEEAAEQELQALMAAMQTAQITPPTPAAASKPEPGTVEAGVAVTADAAISNTAAADPSTGSPPGSEQALQALKTPESSEPLPANASTEPSHSDEGNTSQAEQRKVAAEAS